MKKLVRVLVVFVVFVLALGVVLQIVLSRHLTEILNKTVLPRAESALGVKIALRGASVNLMRASASVSGLGIANPASYSQTDVLFVDDASVRLGLGALWHKIGEVRSVRIEGARLTVERSTQGTVNLADLYKQIQAAAPAVPAATPGAAPVPAAHPARPRPAGGPAALPALLLKTLRADALVEYVDDKEGGTPVRYGFRMDAAADNIATYAAPDGAWGTFSLNGHLDGEPDAFVTRLDGKLAPLTDPARPSFDLDGNVASIDLQRYEKLTANRDVTFEKASLDIRLRCRDGAFDRDQSVLTFRLKNAQIHDPTKPQEPGIQLAEASIPIPVGGTLASPEVDWKQAVTQAILQNVANNPDAVMKALEKQGVKPGKDLNKALDQLGGWLKKD